MKKELWAKKIERAAIDREATALYDRLNPNWVVKINVSKAECIKRVEQLRERRKGRSL